MINKMPKSEQGTPISNSHRLVPLYKAMQNWKISVKALSKRLWKLTITTK